MHTSTCRKYILLFISTYKDIQNILVTTHIYFWKEYTYACSKYCVKITHVHILSVLLPLTTYAHLEYFINIYIFVVSYLFIYAHWRAKLMSFPHLHLFEKEISCHLSTLERQFHIICSSWEAFSFHIQTRVHLQSTWLPIPHVCFVRKVLASCYLF